MEEPATERPEDEAELRVPTEAERADEAWEVLVEAEAPEPRRTLGESPKADLRLPPLLPSKPVP